MRYQGKLPMRFTPEEKLELIQLGRYSGLGFEKTLRLFGLKPSRVYLWIRNIEEAGFAALIDKPPLPKRSPLKHTKQEEEIILNSVNLHTHLNHRSLAHRIFRDKGIFVSESLVYRILKKHNLIRPRRRFKIEATESWKRQPTEPNQIWHIDISYIPCGRNEQGRILFWYLIVVLDGYSRYVISWDLFPDMSKERCYQVVDQALFLAQLPPDKRPRLVSDNGKQFRARRSREFFKELLNIQQIFTRSHHPQTNGKIERLFETVKYEALYRNDYSSAEEARQILLEFFDTYNNHRLHQSLGHRTPQEVYSGLNRDYTQRRQIAKSETINQRRQYWATSGGLLTISKN